MYGIIVCGLMLFLFGSAFLIVWVACQGAREPQAPADDGQLVRLQRHIDQEQAVADEFASHPSIGSLYAPEAGIPTEVAGHGA
ncbi:MAG: hypothetical protein AAB434_05595 [Planctomycetota bacterium]